MVNKKEKILVAMSGGVDSSVVATLLVKAGYDVTGAFMVNYDNKRDPLLTSLLKGGETDSSLSLFKGGAGVESCWHNDYQDALRVAAKLKIPLLKLDFQKEYQAKVLDYMYKEYNKGRTPNPDILCNKFVKFGVWLEKAKKLGFDKLATGHYARLRQVESQKVHKEVIRYELLQAKDTNKDQTYFLHQLNQQQLSKTLFPLGDYTKKQVRALAKKFELPTADKEESMGICFVGEVPMREFLKNKVKAKPGKIISTSGEVLGEHDGLPFYTIGERMGGAGVVIPAQAGIQARSMFVVEKNTKNNTVIVGEANDPALFKKEIIISDVNWISGQTPKLPLKCKVRLRHRQELQDCVVCSQLAVIPNECEESLREKSSKNRKISHPKGIRNDKTVMVGFKKPQRAVTPGQFAVFYLKSKCLGGGVFL